jgi:hypothetical protein
VTSPMAWLAAYTLQLGAGLIIGGFLLVAFLTARQQWLIAADRRRARRMRRPRVRQSNVRVLR